MKTTITTAAIATILFAAAGAAPALAQNVSTPPAYHGKLWAPVMPTTAQGYLAQAGQTDLFEIEAGRIAARRAQKPEIKAFGQEMVDNHMRATHRMASYAEKANVAVQPAVLDARHQQMLNELETVSTSAFDQTYVNMQTYGHEEALRLHQNYAQNGDNQTLRLAAADMVPMIEEHRDQLHGLSPQVLRYQP
ncbi:MAG TPA: DUF4142 domain-containing protein [Ferrovibrio sp.]|uniref:DUF4142 domain-containing protein n=1 Tax=Ferrovibrio sp. TaxID=1917215 RepID=UPI002ED47366